MKEVPAESISSSLSKRNSTAQLLFEIACLIAMLVSMNVSFSWSQPLLWYVCSAFLIGISFLSDHTLQYVYKKDDYAILPTLSCAILLFYMQFTIEGSNSSAYLIRVIQLFIFWGIFRASSSTLSHTGDRLCKAIAIICSISLFYFILHLVGINLPHKQDEFGTYYYQNYYLFLLDMRYVNDIIPRFQGIFLEPGHLGSFCAMLLATQKGKLSSWYNIILIITICLSFSLAAYLLLIISIILHMWIDKKKIFLKLMLFGTFLGLVVLGALHYNKGDNMLNNLIVERMKINKKGDNIEGYNRTTLWFDNKYKNFIQSHDKLIGRQMPQDEAGNAGYKVFIYEHGYIGLILLGMFYLISMCHAPCKRAFVAMLVISSCNFMARAYPIHFAFYIPSFLIAFNLTSIFPDARKE